MNELQAALGLEVLKIVDKEREKRAKIDAVYRSRLAGIDGLIIPKMTKGISSSYQYFVIRIDAKKFGATRDFVYEKLKEFNVFSRRYFYPLCSNMVPFKELPSADPDRLPTANRVAQEVLCLPFYSELSEESADQISAIIRSCAGRRPH
jgi:dTDP-4-amino-4,6-dideoxygalactose transaminase